MKYAVLITESIYIPGDERSRECPGHGYPDSTRDVPSIIPFDTKEKFEQWIVNNEKLYSKKKFTPIRYEELELKIETTIKIESSPKV